MHTEACPGGAISEELCEIRALFEKLSPPSPPPLPLLLPPTSLLLLQPSPPPPLPLPLRGVACRVSKGEMCVVSAAATAASAVAFFCARRWMEQRSRASSSCKTPCKSVYVYGKPCVRVCYAFVCLNVVSLQHI